MGAKLEVIVTAGATPDRVLLEDLTPGEVFFFEKKEHTPGAFMVLKPGGGPTASPVVAVLALRDDVSVVEFCGARGVRRVASARLEIRP